MRHIRRIGALLSLCAAGTMGAAACHDGAPRNNSSDETVSRLRGLLDRYPKPPEAVVDKVEEMLQREPCVGKLDRWLRYYSYGYDTMPKAADTSKVQFEFREAGKFGFVAGRHIAAPAEWVNLDDRDYRLMQGSYDVRTGRVSISYCGPNVAAGKA